MTRTRAERKDNMRALLTSLGLQWESGNYDIHMRINKDDWKVNIWPTTTRLSAKHSDGRTVATANPIEIETFLQELAS